MTAKESRKRPPATVVLVTDQFRCRRLIVAGRKLAERTQSQLEVINVANPDVPQNPEAIEYLFQISKENDATMMVHYSADPAKQISELLNELKPQNVISGMPQVSDSLLHKLWLRFTQIDFFTVSEEGDLVPVTLSSRVIA